MALAKKSRGGVSGWLAAGLLLLSAFAATRDQEVGPGVGAGDPAAATVELTPQD